MGGWRDYRSHAVGNLASGNRRFSPYAVTITEYYVDGPADIVVEIISPESRKIDRNDKYFEYQRAGVREYWLLDPNNNEAEFYRLVEPGRFERVELEDNTRYHSTVLNGFTLDVSLLWLRPLPSVREIVKAWETTEQTS